MAVKKAAAKKADSSPIFNLRYFIVCDDARFDTTGKLMLLGVYNDTILLPEQDSSLIRLSFVFSVNCLTDELPKQGRFSVSGPPGASDALPHGTFALNDQQTSAKTANIVLHIANVKLPLGTYEARLTLNDKATVVGTFIVDTRNESVIIS